ncbi:CLUMA_CG019836, isoform A [Clunio marinus]|uniref:CLUMA_CG019836, isoform A n=1 Tax=Clunio marinus TaxID=568069 RepID=A0A1J1J4R4_9DIPT|nr:CLUMA_CG019836, isoform A [Clunio marinus]
MNIDEAHLLFDDKKGHERKSLKINLLNLMVVVKEEAISEMRREFDQENDFVSTKQCECRNGNQFCGESSIISEEKVFYFLFFIFLIVMSKASNKSGSDFKSDCREYINEQ